MEQNSTILSDAVNTLLSIKQSHEAENYATNAGRFKSENISPFLRDPKLDSRIGYLMWYASATLSPSNTHLSVIVD